MKSTWLIHVLVKRKSKLNKKLNNYGRVASLWCSSLNCWKILLKNFRIEYKKYKLPLGFIMQKISWQLIEIFLHSNFYIIYWSINDFKYLQKWIDKNNLKSNIFIFLFKVLEQGHWYCLYYHFLWHTGLIGETFLSLMVAP